MKPLEVIPGLHRDSIGTLPRLQWSPPQSMWTGAPGLQWTPVDSTGTPDGLYVDFADILN